jgi:DNA-directed RNA polymerase subunit RPC12/RpoP
MAALPHLTPARRRARPARLEDGPAREDGSRPAKRTRPRRRPAFRVYIVALAYPDLPEMTSLRLDQCPICGGTTFLRRKRTFLEKFRHAAIYRCTACRFEASVPLTVLYPQLSSLARCPHCSTIHLKVLAKRDPIERMYHGPLSTIWRWMGAPLLYCPHCRLQFHDFRRRAEARRDRIG